MSSEVDKILEYLQMRLCRMDENAKKMSDELKESEFPPVVQLFYCSLAYVSHQRFNPDAPSDAWIHPVWGKPHPKFDKDDEPTKKVLPINVECIEQEEPARDFRQIVFRFMRNVCDGIQPLGESVGFLTYRILPRTDDEEVHVMFSQFHAALGKTSPPAEYNRHFHETILKYGAKEDGETDERGYLRWLGREINWLRRCSAKRDNRRSVSPDRYSVRKTRAGPEKPSEVVGTENLLLRNHRYFGPLVGELDDYPTLSYKALKLDYSMHPCHCELHEKYIQNVLDLHSWVFIADIDKDSVREKKALIYTLVLKPFVTQFEEKKTFNEEFGEMVRLCIKCIIEFPTNSALRSFALNHLGSISAALRLLESKSHYNTFERPLGRAYCKVLGQIMFVETGRNPESMLVLVQDRFCPWVSSYILHDMMEYCRLLKNGSEVGFRSALIAFRRLVRGEKATEVGEQKRGRRLRGNRALNVEEDIKTAFAEAENLHTRVAASYVIHLLAAKPESSELLDVMARIKEGQLGLPDFKHVTGQDAHRAYRLYRKMIPEVGSLSYLLPFVEKVRAIEIKKDGKASEELDMAKFWLEDLSFDGALGVELGVDGSP